MNTRGLLENIYLFKELNPTELGLVESIGTTQSHNVGEDIFCEGDKADALYVIKFGSVKITRQGRDDSVKVSNLGTGSHFGEMSFIDHEKRSATVTTSEPTETVRIGFDDLQKVLEKNPLIAVKVYRSVAHFLCGRLRITTTDLSFAREKNIRHF